VNADVPQAAALVTLLLAPVFVDRQLATLVTKMVPRHERSLLAQFVDRLAQALNTEQNLLKYLNFRKN
jgi:hypothetical protein